MKEANNGLQRCILSLKTEKMMGEKHMPRCVTAAEECMQNGGAHLKVRQTHSII